MSCENKYPCPLPPCKPDASGKFKLSVGKKECDNKSRFSDRQVKLLETIFETETKIEPLKKVQLARELGLEPRQVAIWFQNRRARWKSKQIEKEYQVLKASYETLTTQVESLKQEKQSLYAQLQSLSLALQKARESENGEPVKPVRLAEMEGNGTFKAIKNYQSSEEPGDSSQASTQDWCGIIACHGLVPPCRETKWCEF